MYIAARIFTVLGMICTAIACIGILPIGIPILAINVVIGIMTLIELKDRSQKPSVSVSILNIMFCSPIAGIIMLCIPKTTADGKNETEANPNTALQCTNCGKQDASVENYAVKTEIGIANFTYCPECKAMIDAENQNK